MKTQKSLPIELQSAWWSPNLQRFLKARPHFNRIYFDPEERIWWIGCCDVGGRFKAAAKLLAVLCNGAKTETWALSNAKCDRVVDRTDQFWKCAHYFGRWMFRKWYWEACPRIAPPPIVN